MIIIKFSSLNFRHYSHDIAIVTLYYVFYDHYDLQYMYYFPHVFIGFVTVIMVASSAMLGLGSPFVIRD